MPEGHENAVREAFARLRRRCSEIRVVVLGDIMLDQFVYGSVERISPEAPVPVVEVDREVYRLGGAANVVHNLRSLGARVTLVGTVGADANAEWIRTELGRLGVEHSGLIELVDRPTAIKTRVIAQHQQIVRFDREQRGPLPETSHPRMLQYLRDHLSDVDAVIVSDYGKGVITAAFLQALVTAATASGTLVAVDPKPVNRDCYHGVTLMTPNVKEAESMSGLPARNDEEAGLAALALLEQYRCEALLLTRGEKGMTVVEGKDSVTHISTRARDVFDVTGAGDTTIAVLTLARAAGAGYVAAAGLANLAAGIAVGKLGTAAVNADELAAVLPE